MIIAECDNWIGCYVDGELIQEDHSYLPEDWVQLTIDYDVTEVEKKFVNYDWMNERGSLPNNLSDVVWDGDDYISPEESEEDY